MGGKGSGGYTEQPESAAERRLREAQADLLDKRMRGLTAGYNPRAFGFNENTSDTTATSANPEYTALQNQIVTLTNQTNPPAGWGMEYDRDSQRRQAWNTQRNQQLNTLNAQLSSMSPTISTGGRTSTFTPMTQEERITPTLPNGQPNPNYDPNFAQQIASQTAFDTGLTQAGADIGAMETEIGKMNTDIQKLIANYEQFDRDTQNEILKLTGYTEEQALELSNQINTLRPLQTEAVGLTRKAGLTLDDLMSGRIPENLKPYFTEAMETEKERLGRMGVSRDTRLEGITRAGTKTALDLMTPYQTIYGANMTNTRGLTSDIANYGQANLSNRTGLSDAAMRYRATGTQNWGNIPVLRGNVVNARGDVATRRIGYTNTYGLRASYYNQLQQQNRENLARLSNWYGQ